MAKVTVKCGWCTESFATDSSSGKYGFGDTRCPNCAKKVKSSKKTYNENGKGIKEELKEGDVV